MRSDNDVPARALANPLPKLGGHRVGRDGEGGLDEGELLQAERESGEQRDAHANEGSLVARPLVKVMLAKRLHSLAVPWQSFWKEGGVVGEPYAVIGVWSRERGDLVHTHQSGAASVVKNRS